MLEKKERILESCSKVLEGIEDGNLSGNAAVLLCKKIARLSDDDEGSKWLSFETSGYPRDKEGHIEHHAWLIGANHGRKYILKGAEFIFTEIIDEIETTIEASKTAINNFQTSGVSFSGENSLLTSRSFTTNVHNSTVEFVKTSKDMSRKKSILINEYYNYALKKEIEIRFGDINEKIFEKYQDRVNLYISKLDKDIHEKLKSINSAVERNDLEANSQALTSCRKIFKLLANDLFQKILPNYEEKTFKTKSGIEIDISGEHTRNKLSAVIETMTKKANKNTLVGSNILYLVDLLDNIENLQSNGVHNDINREAAENCIIQTYVALGGILELYDSFSKQSF